MPEMTPVANQIQPPNLQQGLGNLSSIIGLKQQQVQLQREQQALQTGVYAQQQQQADAQQSQQKNQELQALATFTKNAAKDPSYLNADGSLNVQKFQVGAQSVAPTYGQAYIGQATSNANEAAANRSALLKLTNDQRATAGQYLGAVAADPNASAATFQDAVRRARDVSDDKGYQATLDSMLTHAPQTAGMPDAQAAGAIRGFARQVAVQVGSVNAPLSQPTTSDYTTPQGAIGQRKTNILAPGGTGPVGAPVKQGVPPQIVTPPGGIPTVMKGSGSAPSPGSSGGPQPTSQDWENFGGYNANLNSRVQQATDSLPRIEIAEQALQGMRAGGGAEWRISMARKLQAAGMDTLANAVSGGSLADAQVAEKMLFQTTMSGLRQSMQGDPARVAEFEAADKVFPNVGTDPKASNEILEFMRGQAQRDYAEQQALNKSRKSGTFNPATWQSDYQQQLRAGKVPGVPASQVPASAHKDGDTSKSKSGKPIVWSNGRWEYQ